MIEVDHVVMAMPVTHVGDLCWAIDPRLEHHMHNVLEAFTVNDDKVESGEFWYCGKEIDQLENYSIRITCEPAPEGIGGERSCATGRTSDDLATEGEVGQTRSVFGSLGWIARQCRPDLSLGVVARTKCGKQSNVERCQVG